MIVSQNNSFVNKRSDKMSDLLKSVRLKAKDLHKTIVLAEGEEPRIITAAAKAQAEGVAQIVLWAAPQSLRKNAPTQTSTA